MASFVHTHAKREMIEGSIVIRTDSAIKLMLLKAAYFGAAGNDPDRDFVDNSLTNDPIDHEADCTGYTGGFAGAGRHTLDNRATNIDDANNRVEFDADDESFGALGNGTNNTLGGVALIKEITNDAASPVICVDDVSSDKTTNSGTITYAFNAEGLINF